MAGRPSGTVTFLFTDIEGSTRRWQDDAQSMRAMLVEHDAILRSVIDKHDGHLFKHTGDGVAAAFASAADAVEAAVDAQQRLADVLPVRMGLHTGEAEMRDGDYFGATLNRCARLMGIAHGRQVVCSDATAGLVRDRDDLFDLGEHRLRDLSRPERVWQVGHGDFAALRSLDTAATNLPVQPTALVGRRALIAELCELVERQPLVTLTGVGGVGKTRLAVEAGAELLPRFRDGVWVVELAPLAHDELVLATIADALGVAAQTGEPLATTLVSRLRSKQLLMIIDNCEHVLGPVARLVERLAASAPDVRILATSREPLGVAAERVRAVPPLAEATEAVDLFLDRAAQAGAIIEHPEQRRAIGEICVRLDGIPLAIELAAARARMMAPTQIAERLDQRFRLLTGGGRTAVERHRTLQAAVSWSYELLDDAERFVFERLSTLSGSFDLDAAEAIAAGGAVESFEVLDALGHLVDKSMVLTVSSPTGIRYRLLETLRQFAADRLADRPDASEVQGRHAIYWRDRAVASGRATGGTDQQAVLDAIDADFDNYRTAFAHLLSTGRVNEAASGVLALYAYWQIRRPREGMRWHEQLLVHHDLAPMLRVHALGYAAQTEAQSLGDTVAAERYALDAVRCAEEAGVDAPWGALQAMMFVAAYHGDRDGCERWYERCHQVTANSGHRYRLLVTEATRYMLPGGDLAAMVEHFERLGREVRDHGDPLLVCLCALGHAHVLYDAGQLRRSREVARSALDPRAGASAHCGALNFAATIDLLDGDVASARAAAAEALSVALCEGFTPQLLASATVAAAVAALAGDPGTAATILAGVTRHGGTLPFISVSSVEACRALARKAIDASAGDRGAALGHGDVATLDDLAALALEALA
jgi:predicted ATPase/class 3 adenylate cyclase